MRRLIGPAIALVALLVAAGPALAASWGQPSPITESHDAFPSYARSLAVVGDQVHLVDSRLSGQIEYRRSTDGGAHWSAPIIIAQPDARFTSVLGDPAIAARGSLVIVAYRAHDAAAAYLFIRRSADGGLTWGKPRRVAREVTDRRIGEQSVAISSAGVFVAWTDRVTGAIDLRRSTDGGRHFGATKRVGVTTYTFFPDNPAFTDGLIGLAAAGHNVYLAWSPSGNGPADSIVLSRSGDSGSSFHAPQTIFSAPTYGWPSLRAAGTFLVGQFQAVDGTLQVVDSTDRGRHVSVTQLAEPTLGSIVGEGSVALDAEGHALISYGRSALPNGIDAPVGDVLVRSSHDGGRTWSADETAAAGVTGLGNIGTALPARGPLLVYATCQDASSQICDVARVLRR
jgi:hypothetical protein